MSPTATTTEIIAFCSGKGGTGKTSLISALGYALNFCGHKVLMIDADRATDGFSLFILGPEGMSQLASFRPQNTFTGILEQYQQTRQILAEPTVVHRTSDHDLSYHALISGKGLYGDLPATGAPVPSNPEPWNQSFDRPTFQAGVQELFKQLREGREYDYVLVDTRGGFSFESTDVAAAADSFILATEATYTNFYQDRNLVDRINAAASEMQTKSLLRGIIVNKSIEPPETSYRQELVKEFRLRFEDTFCVMLDQDAAAAYKMQKVVFREAPASRFAYDALQAFQQILKIVTSQWPETRVRAWNRLVAQVDGAIAAHNQKTEAERKNAQEQIAKYQLLEKERGDLKSEIAVLKEAHEQEKKRQDIVLNELKDQARLRQESQDRDLERFAKDRNSMRSELDRIMDNAKLTQEQLAEARQQLAEVERMAHERERNAREVEYQYQHKETLRRAQSRTLVIIFAVLLCVASSLAGYSFFKAKNQADESRKALAQAQAEKQILVSQSAQSNTMAQAAVAGLTLTLSEYTNSFERFQFRLTNCTNTVAQMATNQLRLESDLEVSRKQAREIETKYYQAASDARSASNTIEYLQIRLKESQYLPQKQSTPQGVPQSKLQEVLPQPK